MLADELSPAALAESWAGYERLLVTARGLAYAAALETALKVKETGRIFAEGMSMADLLHGPIAAAGVDLPVLAIDGGGPIAKDARRSRPAPRGARGPGRHLLARQPEHTSHAERP